MQQRLFNKAVIINIFLGITLLLLFFFYIIRLHEKSIYIWDEAIYANNSLEMSVTKNILQYTNDLKPNYYNVKPPLIIVLQALSFSVFGYSEFALRLPTCLFCVGIIILFIYYSQKFFEKVSIGLFASVFFMLSLGSIRPHVFLTGDLDAGLVFFSTWIFLNHLDVLRNKKVKTTHYLIYFMCFLLGYFTKSTAIFLIIPSLFLSLLYYRMALLVLKDKRFYILALLFVAFISWYYLYKYFENPLYTKTVWVTEVLRFQKDIMPWHEQPYLFYFRNFIKYYFSFHLVVILAGVGYLFIKKKNIQEVGVLILMALVYLLFVSIPIVKLEWYDAPVYPIMTFACGIVWEYLVAKTNVIIKMSLSFLSFSILFLSYNYNFQKLYSYVQPQEIEGVFIKQKNLYFQKFKVLKAVEEDKIEHYDALKFYIKKIKIENNIDIQIIKEVKQALILDTIMCCSNIQLDSIKSRYQIQTILKQGNCELIKILNLN